MPAGFGDAEPEDAWHPDDPLPELIDNIARRLDQIAVAAAADDLKLGRTRRRLELVHDDLSHILLRLDLENGF